MDVGEHCDANELLQAQAQLWNLSCNYLKSMSLKCAIQLGIADVIHKHGEPMPLSVLMTALLVPTTRSDAMHRLMNFLVFYGIFSSQTTQTAAGDEEKRYSLTPTSRLLLSSGKTSIAPLLLFCLDPIMVAPSSLFSPWLKGACTTPFDLYHGKEIWAVADDNSEFNSLLNEGMAADAWLASEVLLMKNRDTFNGLKSIIDVGGGTGVLSRAIAKAFTEIKCTVLDLPHVIDALPKDSTVDYIGGDMFEDIPKADAALLKWILHDWNDEKCVKILRRCKEAIPTKGEGGKVIIIDMVVGIVGTYGISVETQLLFDLYMMGCTTGKERNESEWQKLFHAAGFDDYKITPSLGARSIIELFP